MTRQVVLVPGLWMPTAAMALLGTRLGAAGFSVQTFVHQGRAPFEANVERLVRYAQMTLGGRPAHFVGHSLGGVLVLETLQRHAAIAAANVVLLGAPVRGCLTGRRYARIGLARWMMGEAAARWNAREAHWSRPEPLGVVAGTTSIGLGRAIGALPGSNDGVVSVEEAEVRGMKEIALVPVGHSMLLASSRVARLVERFLATGGFA